MTERWLPVVGFEGAYRVSNMGSVRSVRRCGGIISPVRRGRYLAFSLKASPKKAVWSAHKVVAEAFLGPRPSGLQIAHLNGNAHDNRIENLAYVTQGENEQHKRLHGTSRASMTVERVAIIRRIVAAGFTQEEIALLLDISVSAISKAILGQNYANGETPDSPPSDLSTDKDG